MSGLLFLTSNDFMVNKSPDGNILCSTIPGFSLLLFYSTQCKHCNSLIPIFKKLPGTIGGCQFGMINVSTNKACVRMSNNTIAPISYVPYIILYSDGKPYMRYNGPYDDREIRKFIIDVANKIKNKQSFSNSVKSEKDIGIPAYSLGLPLVGQEARISYLIMDDAYPKKK